MKIKPIECWAIIYAPEGNIEYMPDLFYTRSSARNHVSDTYPKGVLRKVKITVVK